MSALQQRDLSENPSCPACGNGEIPPPILYESSRFSLNRPVGLSRCPACRLYFTRPRLVDHNLDYCLADYETVVAKYGPDARAGSFCKNDNYIYYLKTVERMLKERGRRPPYNLLDIGSHCGFFLRLAAGMGFRAYGIEPAASKVRFAREMNGVEMIDEGYFHAESHAGVSFDLVTMFDVLEHIPQPVSLLQMARRRLKKGGLVLCKVPHIQFYLYWRRLVSVLGRLGILPRFPTFPGDPPAIDRSSPLPGFFDLFEHVVHYDCDALPAVFGRAGFLHREVLPAPPTNTRGHYLNPMRTLNYHLARLLFSIQGRPGPFAQGLLIFAGES